MTPAHRPRACAVLALALLCACAGPGDHPAQEDWRIATIMQVDGTLPAPYWASEDCRRSSGVPDGRYASVVVHSHHSVHHRIVLIPSGEDFHSGDSVWVNVDDCSRQAEHHRSRQE
jgi:hypothetical protein